MRKFYLSSLVLFICLLLTINVNAEQRLSSDHKYSQREYRYANDDDHPYSISLQSSAVLRGLVNTEDIRYLWFLGGEPAGEEFNIVSRLGLLFNDFEGTIQYPLRGSFGLMAKNIVSEEVTDITSKPYTIDPANDAPLSTFTYEIKRNKKKKKMKVFLRADASKIEFFDGKVYSWYLRKGKKKLLLRTASAVATFPLDNKPISVCLEVVSDANIKSLRIKTIGSDQTQKIETSNLFPGVGCDDIVSPSIADSNASNTKVKDETIKFVNYEDL